MGKVKLFYVKVRYEYLCVLFDILCVVNLSTKAKTEIRIVSKYLLFLFRYFRISIFLCWVHLFYIREISNIVIYFVYKFYIYIFYLFISMYTNGTVKAHRRIIFIVPNNKLTHYCFNKKKLLDMPPKFKNYIVVIAFKAATAFYS